MRPLIFSVALALFLVSPQAQAGPVDLSTWSVVQYEFNSQPNANWVLSMGNTVATQTVNADASILLSDFNLTNSVINGSWQVTTTGDDDFMGFVFGYQGRGSYYLFDWKQGDQNDPLGFAQRGMSVKRVTIPGNADPTGNDLWPTAGNGARVTLLAHNTIPWADNTLYNFHLEFHPGQFTIEVRQGLTLLQAWTINDNTFQTGRFGFYNYSQGDVRYQGFTLDAAPPLGIPEPATALLLGLGGIALGGFASRRGKAR